MAYIFVNEKLTSILVLCLFIALAKAQIPSLSTLNKYVEAKIPDLTEDVISVDGWELTESNVRDSVISLEFQNHDLKLTVVRANDFSNQITLWCDKPAYDVLNKSVLELKPTLYDSKVDRTGQIVKDYWGEKYGYRVSIRPKSRFAIMVYHRAFEPVEVNEGVIESAFLGETPIPLRQFNNLVNPLDDGTKTGKIAVRVKISKDGTVVDATPGVKGTTLNDRGLWQRCRESVMAAKMVPSDSAPEVRVGVVVFNFKVR